MKLSSLLKALLEKEVFSYKDLEIKGITDNHKDIENGFLFVAISGEKFNGHSFIQSAIENGAACFVVEERKYIIPDKTFILVPSSRRALSQLASVFFENPASSLNIIAITGTNGKTTIAFLIEEIFRKALFPIARFSTIGHRIGDEDISTSFTTPQPLEMHRLFLKAKNKGIKFVVMEVSSHALSLNRVFGIRFSCAIFTNLSEDHLDFHKTIDDYLLSKRRLFLSLDKEAKALVNIDSPSYSKITEGIRARVITYGIEKDADVKASDIEDSKDGTSFSIGKERIKTHLYGRYNIYNCLSAISCAINYGISFEVIKDALFDFKPPSGRFEIIWKNPIVVIDYAHTPDALSSVLNAAWGFKPKRVILVFGCGGNREKEKRPIMGSIADELASLTIVTSDNPRDEDPEIIIDEIEKGMKKPHLRIADRKEAIKKAIESANSDDLVLLSGKGHEDYQIIKDKRLPFNDKEVAWEILKEMQNAKLW
ncbi:MAG: UDP-N-acetylmuramoyl-L-alanyl-D-glutamate--2,6-diaminopimelate ligase [bacterium]